jgi:S1-C subfamily serine protease
MKNSICFKRIFYVLILSAVMNCFAETADLTEPMKESLVYLDISTTTYDQSQPWKQKPVSKDSGFGCAVGPYEVLTTAENIRNLSFLQARLYNNNAYIPATVKTVDYELNLCLLELDKNAMDAPLTPLSFTVSYPKGKQITTYWLSSDNHLTTARSTLDRAEMQNSDISFVKNLTYFATNVSRPFGDGEVCCDESDVIGMAFWGTDSDSGIIPSETINSFLSNCKKETYSGFAAPGFKTYSLLDPTMRAYLKMPAEIKNGVYVSTVYSIGTGSEELKHGDVILSISGQQLNSYGRYEHPEYRYISFEHILSKTPAGDTMPFEIFRDGKKMAIDVIAKGVESDNMLVPYYGYGKQPEFIVAGGFILQKLTRDYLAMRGSDWSRLAPPHLYHYYSNMSFMPSDERKDIVILSYVLPIEMNLGYHQLSGLVVDSINGTKISTLEDVAKILNPKDGSENIEISFEMDNPEVIIPRQQLNTANMQVSQLYGIQQMANIKK